ncbi:MAG: hypothetical protein ACXV3F_07730 [Frankiaceae bacterium]
MSAVPLLYAAVGLVVPQPFFAISAVVYLALVTAPLAMFLLSVPPSMESRCAAA